MQLCTPVLKCFHFLHQFCSTLDNPRQVSSSLSYRQRNFSSGMGTAGMGPHSLIRAEAGFEPWALPLVLCVLCLAASLKRGPSSPLSPQGVTNSLGGTDVSTVDTEPCRASLPRAEGGTEGERLCDPSLLSCSVSKPWVPGPVPELGHRGATCSTSSTCRTLAYLEMRLWSAVRLTDRGSNPLSGLSSSVSGVGGV